MIKSGAIELNVQNEPESNSTKSDPSLVVPRADSADQNSDTKRILDTKELNQVASVEKLDVMKEEKALGMNFGSHKDHSNLPGTQEVSEPKKQAKKAKFVKSKDYTLQKVVKPTSSDLI